jgi:hypothetical protein
MRIRREATAFLLVDAQIRAAAATVLLVVVSAILLTVTASGLASSARAATTCDVYASPLGSDSGSGTSSAPFRTVQELVNALGAGQTGCLASGVYNGSVRIANGGHPGAPVTLTSDPGQTATIAGRLEIVEGANYVTVTGLALDGANQPLLPSPTIDSNHDTFAYDDVTNDHTGICFAIGSATWGWATGTVITHDQVHGCGQDTPSDNLQHGFYIGGATDTTVEWSMIYDNAARGIQLYPDAQHTTIDHNSAPRRRIVVAPRQPRRRRQPRPRQLRLGRTRGHNRLHERRLHGRRQPDGQPALRRSARRRLRDESGEPVPGAGRRRPSGGRGHRAGGA